MNDKSWLSSYDPGVPPSLRPYPEKTLYEMVHETAQGRPDHPALIFKGRRTTYDELDRQTDAFAAALVELGVRKGDVITLLMPNIPQFLVAEFGAHKAGAIISPLNPLYTERELEYALNESGTEFAVVMSRFYPKLKSLQDKTRLRRIIVTNIKEALPPVLRVLYTLIKEKKDGDRVELLKGDLWMKDLLAKHQGQPRPPVEVRFDDPAILLFSGGTTGVPKAAIGSHQGLVMSGMQLYSWFKSVLEEWHDIIMLNLPLFHVYAQAGVMPVGIVARTPLALIPNPRDLDDLLETIHKVHPAFLPGVPTLFTALTNHPKVASGKVSLHSLKLCISGAAPLHIETKQRFEALTGGKILEGFGMTETMMATIVTPVQGVYKVGSTGIPVPDVEARIVDAEMGESELPRRTVGELLVRAPQNMKGYYQRPTETANAIRDGWIYTGDLAYMDEDGYIFIVDRKKDVIKVSGFQVWPREVEEVIAAHPAVLEVGVAGIPDAQQGEAVKAWIVLSPAHAVSEAELREFCKKQLAAYKVPRYIEFRDSLPKSMVGKVLRRELVSEK
jgi:long-chain acyl-CoA synthetase